MIINLDMIQSACAGVLIFLLGKKIIDWIPALNRFCIPAPVVGGLLFALIHLIGRQTGTFSFEFSNELKDFFMVTFFTTIGFSASWKIVKSGGWAIIVLTIVSVICLVGQNLIGSTIAMAFGENPLMGLCAGAISLMGGVASSAAYGPTMEAMGMQDGTLIAISAAVFGLVAGGLVSGPLARFLIDKYDLLSKAKIKDNINTDNIDYENLETGEEEVSVMNVNNFTIGFFMLIIAMGIGTIVKIPLDMIIQKINPVASLPIYIGPIIVAAIIRNIGDAKGKEMPINEMSVTGEVFLNIFLAMTIMQLEVWKLIGIAGPLLVILLVQTIVLAIYDILVVFRANGKDYDAAMMVAGFYGYAMGATPNAIASMNAVQERYKRGSPKAYFAIPVVGGFIIDMLMPFFLLTHAGLLV
ncbi:sodium/glutamate symporter [Anaerosphaera multitolerans]|uniref:Sodium/glutamate symporter n=1 Tax=Anaerosphaera multitolerans TaxID=2487351 RepID=A0A437S677_9FIRM|nr:sodium/glutamate symporter [Anaerosphaera multitolerans]RVU54521.1 sodium/glutamate symporter [Anaerosphaera multitolerans]